MIIVIFSCSRWKQFWKESNVDLEKIIIGISNEKCFLIQTQANNPRKLFSVTNQRDWPTYPQFSTTIMYLKLFLQRNKQEYESHHLKQIFCHQNTIMIFLISYVPILCFLLWNLFILCLSIFLSNKVSLTSLNSVAIFTPFAILDSLPPITSLTLIQQTHQLFFLQTRLSFYQ